MKRLSLILLFASCLLFMAGGAFAQTTAPLTINATVSSALSLALGAATINFDVDSDPDTEPSIPANENDVSVTVKARVAPGAAVDLTHRAATDLTGVPGTIAISNVSWIAGGSGFVSGTMSTGSDVSAGSWTGPGTHNGTFTYSLVNSWSYAPGSYTATSTYTLSTP